MRFALHIAERVDDLRALVVDLARDAGLEPVEAGGTVRLEVALGKEDAVVEADGVPRTVVERLARELAGRGVRVCLVTADVPSGRRGRGVTASREVYEGGTVVPDDDTQEAAAEIVADWVADMSGGFDEEELEEELATELLDLDKGVKRRSSVVAFRPVSHARLAPFLAAIREGTAVDLVDVQGRRAAKLRGRDGVVLTAVLDDAERAILEEALARR